MELLKSILLLLALLALVAILIIYFIAVLAFIYSATAKPDIDRRREDHKLLRKMGIC